MFARVNEEAKLPILRIAADDDDDETLNDDVPYEDIEDPIWERPEHQLAYPPNPRFLFSYNCYLQHVACSWTINENDPLDDYDKFARASPEFRRMIMRTAACIMIGDSVVLDKLRMNVTARPVRLMLTNQEDRENTHQIVYSKWCDVDPENSAYYRSTEFRQRYMGAFERMAEKYRTSDIRVTIFFIMLCENVMFAPFFLVLNYLAKTGYAPKICNSNLMVMKDEHIHYVHARGLAASFRRKIPLSLARQILAEFRDVTAEVMRDIVDGYDDGFFNYAHVMAHFNHVVHGFMQENSLYRTANEEAEGQRAYGRTPAESYISLAKAEIKINLMETVSTIYQPDGVAKEVDMSF